MALESSLGKQPVQDRKLERGSLTFQEAKDAARELFSEGVGIQSEYHAEKVPAADTRKRMYAWHDKYLQLVSNTDVKLGEHEPAWVWQTEKDTLDTTATNLRITLMEMVRATDEGREDKNLFKNRKRI